MTRVTYREESSKSGEFEKLYSVLGLLSYMLKVRIFSHSHHSHFPLKLMKAM